MQIGSSPAFNLGASIIVLLRCGGGSVVSNLLAAGTAALVLVLELELGKGKVGIGVRVGDGS